MTHTPKTLEYRWPAEWEPHDGTMLSWPNREGISFPNAYDKILPTYIRMIEFLSEVETVFLNISKESQRKEITNLVSKKNAEKIKFLNIATQEPWCRDHGPIFLLKEKKRALLDWGYNAWGEKYTPFDLDNEVPKKVASLWGEERFEPKMILEGGSIEGNGEGVVLTTRSCLLNKNRNPDLTQPEIEQRLYDYLNVKKILWLGDGIEGDDTDGHIDDLTRFTSPKTIVTAVEKDKSDANHLPLEENRRALKDLSTEYRLGWDIVEIPMPPRLVREELRLPCSYANFYIANEIVLLPTFAAKEDEAALSILKDLFPQREVIGIDCRELIWGLGAFHCLSQQVPRRN